MPHETNPDSKFSKITKRKQDEVVSAVVEVTNTEHSNYIESNTSPLDTKKPKLDNGNNVNKLSDYGKMLEKINNADNVNTDDSYISESKPLDNQDLDDWLEMQSATIVIEKSTIKMPIHTLPAPIIAEVISYMSYSDIMKLSQLNQFWNHRLKTLDRFGNDASTSTIENGYSKSMYGDCSLIKNKLYAMGFEKELMHEWTKGFTYSATSWQRFGSLVDMAQKGFELLKTDDQPKTGIPMALDMYPERIELKKYFEEMVLHLDINLNKDRAALQGYSSFVKDPNKSQNGNKFEFLKNYQNSLEIAVFANCNPFILIMALLFYMKSNEGIAQGLLAMMKDRSLQVLRHIKFGLGNNYSNSCRNKHYSHLASWINAHLPNLAEASYIFDNVLYYRLQTLSTDQIIEKYKDFTSKELSNFNNASASLASHRAAFLEKLLGSYISNEKGLGRLNALEIPNIKGIQSKNFLHALVVSQSLAKYFIAEANNSKQDLATFAEDHINVLSLLVKLTAKQLQDLTRETSFAELNYICNTYNVRHVYEDMFEEEIALKKSNRKAAKENRIKPDKGPKCYREKILKYLEGFEDKNKENENISSASYLKPALGK